MFPMRRLLSVLRVTLLSHGFDIPPFMLFSFLPPTVSEGANLTLSLLFFLKVLSFNLSRKKKKKKTLARGHRSHQGAFPTHWPFNQAKVQRCGSFLQPPLLAVRKGEVHQHKQRHTQLPVLLSSTGCQITMTRTLPCSLFFGPHTHEHSIYISLFDYFSLRQE